MNSTHTTETRAALRQANAIAHMAYAYSRTHLARQAVTARMSGDEDAAKAYEAAIELKNAKAVIESR